MTETGLGALARRLAAGRDAFVELRRATADGEPWPLAEHFGTEPESSWLPREVLAHVAEFLPFWLGEVERILAGPAGEPVPFGRTAEDPLRIGIIGRDRTLPLVALDDRIDTWTDVWLRRLAALDSPLAGREGRHPTLGTMTVAGVVERFAARHVEEHAEQLREIVERPA